jgi:hypothetical protein
MATTQSAYDWLRSKAAPARPGPAAPEPDLPEPHTEIERVHNEIATLVSGSNQAEPRAALDSALDAVARLQVVNANNDACNPPRAQHLGRALVSFADSRLSGHADAIERGMTYTADNTMRLLRGK